MAGTTPSSSFPRQQNRWTFVARFRRGDEPVRIGFDDNRALGDKETGSRTALPIFREVMLRVYEEQLVGPVPQFPRAIEDGIDQYLARQAALTAERDTPPLQTLGASFIGFTPMDPGPISIRATMAGPSPTRSTAAR